jgi:TRAP-type C4-dicarboxylate transport system permease small subunit
VTGGAPHAAERPLGAAEAIAAGHGGVAALVVDPYLPAVLVPLARLLLAVHRAMVAVGMFALLAAAAVLTGSVASRYFWKASTDWQDETAVFLLVGATFLCGAFVQALRGHVAIEAAATWMPAAANRWRLLLVDLFCTLFCAFFAWKSWTLLHEAWADGQTTSSSWAPPLWIPYAAMAVGMSLLALQLALQAVADVGRLRGRLRDALRAGAAAR